MDIYILLDQLLHQPINLQFKFLFSVWQVVSVYLLVCACVQTAAKQNQAY